jgi:hypothetical protein
MLPEFTGLRAGSSASLKCSYPDLFPYLRPEVYAPRLALERHRNPATGNLCLLDRSTRSWRPKDTGAWLVAERVRHLLSLFRAGLEAMAAAEVAQGEPASTYYPVTPGTVVFVPAAVLELRSDVSGVRGDSFSPPTSRRRSLSGHCSESWSLARAEAGSVVLDMRIRPPIR